MSPSHVLEPREEGADTIRARPYPKCYLCETQGELLYENLTDRLFGTRGTWNLKRCPNPNCGMAWLDPLPVEEDIAKAYATYYTHSETPTRTTWLARVLRRGSSVLRSLANPLHRERESLFLMNLDRLKPGKVLDVGCGNGLRLARLQTLGWDVYGQDVDPIAVVYARETLRLEVYLGRLQDAPFAENSFDCVTLNHVIEHTHDPVGLLKQSRRFLKTGGLLVVVTPNLASFAHKHFGPFWRGIEPPRHIHLFSPKTLAAIATKAGLTIYRLRTTVANAQGLARGSLAVRNCGSPPATLNLVLSEIYSLGHLYRSLFQHLKDADSGEECILQATH
jgi:2-polyprenyl-3-methyl-5-hydroxy-6-metoxy-1,4-benzoquinol methylase